MNLSVFQPVFLAIISCHLLSQAKRGERNMSRRRMLVECLTAERRDYACDDAKRYKMEPSSATEATSVLE